MTGGVGQTGSVFVRDYGRNVTRETTREVWVLPT